MIAVMMMPDVGAANLMDGDKHGREALDKRLPEKVAETVAPNKPSHHIEGDFESCPVLRSSPYGVTSHDDRIPEHCSPTDAVRAADAIKVLLIWSRAVEMVYIGNLGTLVFSNIGDSRTAIHQCFLRAGRWAGAEGCGDPAYLLSYLCDGIYCALHINGEASVILLNPNCYSCSVRKLS